MNLSSKIVAQARTWLGTPFHHQARVKGKGCDCLGLVIGVVRELGLKDQKGKLLASYDEVTYSRVPSGVYLLQKLSSILDAVPLEDAKPGDLAVFDIMGNSQHLAILTDYKSDNGDPRSSSSNSFGLIHCDVSSGRVVECRLDDGWRSRLTKVFRLQ